MQRSNCPEQSGVRVNESPALAVIRAAIPQLFAAAAILRFAVLSASWSHSHIVISQNRRGFVRAAFASNSVTKRPSPQNGSMTLTVSFRGFHARKTASTR
jgi:hypothetical protein